MPKNVARIAKKIPCTGQMRAAISKMSAKISIDSYPKAAKLLLHVC